SGCRGRHPRLPLSRGSEPVPALDWESHGVKIPPVGVEVLQVDEEAFVVDEVGPGMPRCDMQLDQAVPGHPEGNDILNARPCVVAEIARWRHADQPFLAAERAQALRDPPMPTNPAEAEPDVWQMHDPQPRLAVAEDELRLACRRLGVVAGLRALATCLQWRDDLAVGGKRLRR